jgi:putative membrane protein
MTQVRFWLLLATAIGCGVAVWTLGTTGWGGIWTAVARIGPGGFTLFCLWFLGVFGLLGAAWHVAALDEPPQRVWLFAAARMLRESAADLLPFSQLGGLVLGVRMLIAQGLPQSRVNAALLVDLTAEMAAQLVFSLAGLALFLVTVTSGAEAAHLRPLVFAGMAVMLAVMAAFLVAQRSGLGLASRLSSRILPGGPAAADAISGRLREIYARRTPVALSFLYNFLAWAGSAMGAWLGLRLMGVPAMFWQIVMVESLIFTLRSVAFMIPGALGVQELGYALLAPVAHIPAEALLALSLIKRARDVAIGVPTLVAWQLSEMRAMVAGRAK